jgi:DNA-binding transcriptional regulator YiaG
MKNLNNERIRGIRMALKMTEEDFAKVVGVSCRVINRWENDRVRPSHHAMRTIEALARGLSQP